MPTSKSDQPRPVVLSSDDASGRDSRSGSLMPMLIVGLVLITLGAIGVMMFV